MDRLLEMLQKMQLPFAYDHFAEGEAPQPPFLCYQMCIRDRFTAQEDSPPEPESFAFSRRAVTNSLLSKLPRKTEQKQPAEPLYQRLNLLKF